MPARTPLSDLRELAEWLDHNATLCRNSNVASSAEHGNRLAGWASAVRHALNQPNLGKAIELLKSYLSDFPEHDQGDFRVWEALGFLEGLEALAEHPGRGRLKEHRDCLHGAAYIMSDGRCIPTYGS